MDFKASTYLIGHINFVIYNRAISRWMSHANFEIDAAQSNLDTDDRGSHLIY